MVIDHDVRLIRRVGKNMWRVQVERDKCTGCGDCVESCPGEVYELREGKAEPVRADDCHGCHTCEAICPAEALHIEED